MGTLEKPCKPDLVINQTLSDNKEEQNQDNPRPEVKRVTINIIDENSQVKQNFDYQVQSVATMFEGNRCNSMNDLDKNESAAGNSHQNLSPDCDINPNRLSQEDRAHRTTPRKYSFQRTNALCTPTKPGLLKPQGPDAE